MSTDNDSPPIAKVDSQNNFFDHRDPEGKICTGIKKLLKENDREDDLLILSYLQGK